MVTWKIYQQRVLLRDKVISNEITLCENEYCFMRSLLKIASCLFNSMASMSSFEYKLQSHVL